MPGRGLGLFLESREVAWSGVAGSRLKGWDQCQGPLKRPPPPSCQSGVCPEAGQPSEREGGCRMRQREMEEEATDWATARWGPRGRVALERLILGSLGAWASVLRGAISLSNALPNPDFYCHEQCSSWLDIFNNALPSQAAWLPPGQPPPSDSPRQVCSSSEWVWKLRPPPRKQGLGWNWVGSSGRGWNRTEHRGARPTGPDAAPGLEQASSPSGHARRCEATLRVALVTYLSIACRRSQPLPALPGLLPSNVLHAFCPAGWDRCHDHR